MKKVDMSNHDFVPTSVFSPNDRAETWLKSYRCKNCGIRGRRYTVNEDFVYVTDSFSDDRIKNCVRDNFVDKYLGTQIQTCCKISSYPEIPIYSVHTVIKPPSKFLNGERGVWIQVKGNDEPVQILFDECIPYPIKRRRPPQIKEIPRKKVIPPYLIIKHVRTKVNKPKFTRTISPVKRKRTR